MIRYIRTFQLVLATASVATASFAATTFTPGDLATAAVAPIAEQMASQKGMPQHPMKNDAMQKEAMPAPMMNDFKPFTAEAFKLAMAGGQDHACVLPRAVVPRLQGAGAEGPGAPQR